MNIPQTFTTTDLTNKLRTKAVETFGTFNLPPPLALIIYDYCETRIQLELTYHMPKTFTVHANDVLVPEGSPLRLTAPPTCFVNWEKIRKFLTFTIYHPLCDEALSRHHIATYWLDCEIYAYNLDNFLTYGGETQFKCDACNRTDDDRAIRCYSNSHDVKRIDLALKITIEYAV